MTAADLPLFFEHQRDPDANRMAAFTAADPENRPAFDAHWARIGVDPAITLRTILDAEDVAGYVVAYPHAHHPEVGFWLARASWGRGIATAALRAFLAEVPSRPLYARAAADNTGSIRVLEKCGFVALATERAYAGGRGTEIDEMIFLLET